MAWRNVVVQSKATSNGIGGGTGSQPAAAPPPSARSQTTMDEMMQRAVVFTAVLMAILGGTLFVVGLERLIRGRFTLFSMVRFLLRFTFVIFLPLLSYMRANAKEGEILFVLLWMLLIELFRKKVEAMVPPANDSFSRSASRFRLMGHSDEVTRLVWIGFLIYSNVDWQSKKGVMLPMFAILWILAVAKLGQRVLNEWKAEDSLSAAGSANLIAGYMKHVLDQEEKEEEDERHKGGGSSRGSGAGGASPDPDPESLIGKCQYVVIGEEKLVLNKKERRRRETTGSKSKVLITSPHCGHGVGRFPHDQDELKHVHLLVNLNKVKNLVTVKDVWQNLGRWLFVGNKRPTFIDHMCLMCLSFSLFKLLRRRFEHYPMVEVGSKMSWRLMLQGLLNHKPAAKPADNASTAFRVIQLELDFLDNYYQAGVPVVMSAPWLFFINFLSSLLFVSIYVLAVVMLVYITRHNTESVTKYFIITMLLVLTLLAVEITDFLTTYLFSNWFLVHLLCLYVAPGGCLWNFLVKPIICCFIAYRLLVFCLLRLVLTLTGRPVNEKKMKIRQVSILQVCEPVHKMFAWASQVTLPTEAKVAMVEDLKAIDLDTGDVSLPHYISGFRIQGKTATEIILACHVATELLEVKHGKPKKKKKPKQKPQDRDHQTVATTLSRYCMYLVARVPELLPDDERWVSDRYEDVKRCLKKASRRCCCSTWCCPWRRTGRWKAVAEMTKEKDQLKEATAQAGVELYQHLGNEADAWKVLAEFWVKLLIYLAPSNDVEGHAKALASSGSDLITCLWALCTHAGIKRRPSEPPAELHAGSQQV